MLYQCIAAAVVLALGADARMISRNGNVNGQAEQQQGGRVRSGNDFCTMPVVKERVAFPASVAGRATVDYEMYSGYINVTSEDWLFYWFFGTADGNEDAPLVIWTNGGPGCTSMEGATTEHGPLVLVDIKEACSSDQCDYTGQLSSNPYAWNAHANVLYLDQPRNVGYSFGAGAVHSSREAALDFVTFHQEWVKEFPEFSDRETIISGESYGGHYVPAWADAVLDHNAAAGPSQQINLQGVIIGNGCVNDTVQDGEQYIAFLQQAKLLPEGSSPRSQAVAEVTMIEYIGYVPNYYDYRVESVSCEGCYGYNYSAWAHWFLEADVLESLHVCGAAGEDAFAGASGGCVSMGAFDAADDMDYSGALARALEAGIPVTLFYGKTDTACNYVGGLAMADSISWTGGAAFSAAPLTAMEIAGVEAGQMKSAGGLTWIQVDGAGHMVPLDQPAAASVALNSIIAKFRR
jgi:cathepsin A (carboxypeptidase C)